MSVVTFYGSDKIETSQTSTMASIATYLSLEKDYKILLINTKHNDTSLESYCWEKNRFDNVRADLESGINGLIKAIASNKTSPEIITNYTKTIFKDRLEVLTSDIMPKENYEKIKAYIRPIIKMASRFYDLVFVDLEGNIQEPLVNEILAESNLTIANVSQSIRIIDDFIQNKKMCGSINNKNLMYLIGKYDPNSRYNIKNLKRIEKIDEVYGIPYNTLFFDSCNEGKLVDFIINNRYVRQTNAQAMIMDSITIVAQSIIDKLKELQMQG